MEGCPALYHQINKPLGPRYYIDQVATYTHHFRAVLYPYTYKWESEEEMVFDFLMDDYFSDHPHRKAMYTGLYTQMAVACSCHPTFQEVCVIELGHEVEPVKNSDYFDSEYDQGAYYRRNLQYTEIPILKQKGETCPKKFDGPYCKDYGWDSDHKREAF